MKILIVEDSEQMRRMIKSFVGDLVEEISQCGDGSQALAAYTEHRPDLVFMDIKMIGMDGLAATGQIKAAFPEARIIVVSQWDSPALRDAALKAGAEGYVWKADLLPLRHILGERKG
jgi:CheY-like chemotaxis protein